MSYREKDIRHETRNYWVLDVGAKGFEVYRKGITHSTRVAIVGIGPGLGLARAVEHCDRLQAESDKDQDRIVAERKRQQGIAA